MFQYAERGEGSILPGAGRLPVRLPAIANEAGLYPGFRVQTVTMPAVLVHFH
jgi:hypothetical protein